jgi:hypothetical protein
LIDLAEDLLSLPEAAARLPLRGGRTVSTTTLHRWATAGVGGVVLESLRVGGARYTSAQALGRFVNRLNATEGTPGLTPAVRD